MKKAQIELCHWSSQLCKKLQDNNKVINYICKQLQQRGATWGARKTTMKRTFQDIFFRNSFFSITYLPLFSLIHTICPFPQFFPFFFVELTSLSQPLFWILQREEEEEKMQCAMHCVHPFILSQKIRVRNKMRVLYCYLHLHKEKNTYDNIWVYFIDIYKCIVQV